MQNDSDPKSKEEQFFEGLFNALKEASEREKLNVGPIQPPLPPIEVIIALAKSQRPGGFFGGRGGGKSLGKILQDLHGVGASRPEASADPHAKQAKIAKEIQACIDLINDLIKQGHAANLTVKVDHAHYSPFEQFEAKFSIPLKITDK